jgi:hypothetical protein
MHRSFRSHSLRWRSFVVGQDDKGESYSPRKTAALFFQSSLRDLFFCCAFPALASLRAGLLSFAPAALVSTAEGGCAPRFGES